MKKKAKRLLNLALALVLVMGSVKVPVLASPADTETTTKTETVVKEESKTESNKIQVTVGGEVITLDADKLNVSGAGSVILVNTDNVVVNNQDPAIKLMAESLGSIKVLNEDGESVSLTPEQQQTILAMYQQYLDHWAANADILGVQLPFFLSYNDKEDDLGILGEMLALANIPLAAVRAGQVSYDDLTGMIQNFLFGDQLGVQLYREAIVAARNEVMAEIEASGAKTEEQKLLVINDWLAHHTIFDMPYIMNADKEPGEEPMVAEDPVKHKYYDTVYGVIYDVYEEQITAQFHDQIYAGIVADLRQKYYEGAIEQGYYQSVLDAVADQVATEQKNAKEKEIREAAELAKENEIREAAELAKENEIREALGTAELTDEQKAAITAAGDKAVEEKAEEITAAGDAAVEEKAEEIEAAGTAELTDEQKAKIEAAGDEAVAEKAEEIEAAEDPATKETEIREAAKGVKETEIREAAKGAKEAEIRKAAEDIKTTEVRTTAEADAETAVREEAKKAELTDEQKAAITAAGDTAVEEKAEEIAAAGDAAVATEENQATIQATYDATFEAAKESEDAKAAAQAETDKFMTENAEAIKNDAPGFVEAAFGAEAAAQIAAGADAFIEEAKTNGVEVDPVNAPGYKMTVEQLTQQTMENEALVELGTDENGNVIKVTPNEAIPIYADQAAQGLTAGVLDYWEGSHIGALGEGKAVCLGYSKAFSYLVQFIHPEIYGVNGEGTDMTVASNWKTAADLYYTNDALDINKNYATDLVRITFDASVTMYGETQDNFNSDHFWNAVKIGEKWYYVDPCYTDVYTEVMMRDRVETDGSMNHLYFLFSHNTAASLYDGNYSEIKTLYESAATHKDYEDSWISRIKSNIYSDGFRVFYVYDSTDLITMMEDYNENSEITTEESLYKLVYHTLTSTDAGKDGDTNYTTLVEFNYKANEDDDTTVARYLDANGEMVESELLTKLYAQHTEEMEVYPSIAITAALDGDLLYFNLSNCILAYDVEACTVTLVKEYNTVHGLRDKTNPFGGMAFTVVDSADEADFTVENHPIAGLTIKEDGTMYVAIATNFAFISGKNPHNSADQSSYGYEFEESNYNSAYSNYGSDEYDDSMMESFGYTKETNDNDEFMWSANFVDSFAASELSHTHSYEEVSVDAYCGRNAYTENRCTTCGASEDGSRVEVEDTAHAHHYVRFAETFYTKDDSGAWNTGTCYVCTMCGFSTTEPVEPDPDANYEQYGSSYEERLAEYEKEKAIYDEAVATAGHTYAATDATWATNAETGEYEATFTTIACSSVCLDRVTTLDCLLGTEKDLTINFGEEVTAAGTITDYTGDCMEGVYAVYTATGEEKGYKYTATTEVQQEAGKHTYEGEFEWSLKVDDEGNPLNEYTVIADVTCVICGDTHEDLVADGIYSEEDSYAPTCTEAGADVYVAEFVVTDDGEELGSFTAVKEITLDALGHTLVDLVDNKDHATHTGTCTTCGETVTEDHAYVDNKCECGAIGLVAPTIKSVYSKVQTSVKVTWTLVEGADGYELYRATSLDEDAEWSRVKTIKDGATERYTNQDLTVGQTYYYKVRAYVEDAEGNKTYSEFSNVKYMPAAVVITKAYSSVTYRIRLGWQEIGGADGYQIWRQNEDGTYSIIKTIGDKGNELTNDQGATTGYSNTGLTAGQTYTYKMRAFAFIDGQKIYGAYSDEITAAAKPATPVVTVTSTKAERAQLSWEALNGAAGYQIWMSDAEDGKFSIAKSITDGTATSYTKYDLESGKTYYFKVRTYTDVEGKKTFSDYSEIVSVVVK